MREITQLPVGEAFTAGWRKLREVIDHLRCLRPIAGNGIRITERPNGFIIDVLEHTHNPVANDSSHVASYSGPHAVTYNDETGKVCVSAGYAMLNGAFSDTTAVSDLDPQTGIICVSCAFSGTSWGTPTIGFSTPSAHDYPIGKCTVTGTGTDQTVEVESFCQPVAILFEVGECE